MMKKSRLDGSKHDRSFFNNSQPPELFSNDGAAAGGRASAVGFGIAPAKT